MGRRSSRYPADHFLVRGFVDGWFICSCGCGYVAVCRHCVPGAPGSVAAVLCDTEGWRLKAGRYAKEEGREGNA